VDGGGAAVQHLGELTAKDHRAPPGHIRSDNGPEFVAKAARSWISEVGVETMYIQPGNPWESGYKESFIGTLRDELLNGEIFGAQREAEVLIERRWRHDNTVRPHGSLDYRPPASEAVLSRPAGRADATLGHAEPEQRPIGLNRGAVQLFRSLLAAIGLREKSGHTAGP
jgi:hypothetical protein